MPRLPAYDDHQAERQAEQRRERALWLNVVAWGLAIAATWALVAVSGLLESAPPS